MESVSIRATQYTPPTVALRVAAGIASALLAALLLGSLLSGDWTLPMDPVIASAFTA